MDGHTHALNVDRLAESRQYKRDSWNGYFVHSHMCQFAQEGEKKRNVAGRLALEDVSYISSTRERDSPIFGRITVSTLACQLDGKHLPKRR